MTADLAIVLALLGACILMFAAGRPRLDVVGLLAIAALPMTGIITFREAVAGFSDPNILLIAMLFVLGEGLVRTGVARRIGDWIAARAGGSETRLVVLLMLAAAGLGATMSSTAVVAIFIPIVLRICAGSGLSPRGLMMPLSIAAMVSGMMTLIATSPNLVIQAELLRTGSEGFGFFTITPFGLVMLGLAILYMLWARRGLTAGEAAPGTVAARPSVQDWIARYDLPERELRARIARASPLAGAALGTLGLRAEGVNILAIERPRLLGADLLRPEAELVLAAGDVLMLDVQARGVQPAALLERLGLLRLPLEEGGRYFTTRTQRIGMVEAMVPAESPLVGRTLLELRTEGDTGVTAIGLRRKGEPRSDRLLERRLKVGDTLLLFGFWSDIEKLRATPDVIVPINLPAEFDEVLPAPGRAAQAVACFALTIGLMVSGALPNAHAALLGCLLLLALRCIDMAAAYRAISWNTLVLIVGMMPFALALDRTGGVDLAADALLALAGGAQPRLAIGALFLATALVGLFISTTATAILMAPVALAVAEALGASPLPFAMTVALAASSAFMTPVSSPVNMLVVTPGGYGFLDFVRVGVPLWAMSMLVAVLLVPVLLPL